MHTNDELKLALDNFSESVKGLLDILGYPPAMEFFDDYFKELHRRTEEAIVNNITSWSE